MKTTKFIMVLALLGLGAKAFAEPVVTFEEETIQFEDPSQENEHEYVLNPEEEERYYLEAQQKGDFEILNFKFPQEHWFECEDEVTGNFLNYKCASRRQISSILNDYLQKHVTSCVQEALDSVDGGTIEKLHIIHDGILGDKRHSPKSLHAENRAIDIRIFDITTTEGTNKKYVYEDKKNRDFFLKFRTCWGHVISENNDCPIYAGTPHRTGSIGWEDKNHQHHMHTSVPYCVNGKYGNYFYQR